MPTTHKRTYVTHTPPIQRALARAERRWPEAHTSTSLFAHIAQEWADVDERRDDPGVDATAGKYRGVFEAGYLNDLRAEWRR